jgi:NAD(P)-dependent dehydrogenase (short-subunit alcohol dehydrogenase family)
MKEARYPGPPPPQHQERRPGIESAMRPRPMVEKREYRGADKLAGKVALITGGDSGIGRAVAILFAREGADVSVAYLDEHGDAAETRRLVEREGRRCALIAGDLGDEETCRVAVEKTLAEFGKLDILVNNAGEQHPRDRLEDVSREQLERTFRTNIFAYFFLTKAALPHLREGSAIINTTSVTAYRGNAQLIDYSATKGAIAAFTYSLSQHLVKRGIRVNAVAPGPVWTPLIPSTFSEEHVAAFGESYPMGRPGQPEEIAPSYVFLASADSSYMTGQVLHPNGGAVVHA